MSFIRTAIKHWRHSDSCRNLCGWQIRLPVLKVIYSTMHDKNFCLIYSLLTPKLSSTIYQVHFSIHCCFNFPSHPLRIYIHVYILWSTVIFFNFIPSHLTSLPSLCMNWLECRAMDNTKLCWSWFLSSQNQFGI